MSATAGLWGSPTVFSGPVARPAPQRRHSRGGTISAMSKLTKLLPGLGLVALLTLAAYLLASVGFLALVGPLVLAMLLGILWRAIFGLPNAAKAGAAFAAGIVLKVGIVLLGVRLDFALLAQVGPVILLATVLVVGLGILAIDRIGAWMGMGHGLRLGIAIGTSVCGASAIVAAVPVIGAKAEDAGVAVGVISVLGTIGVLLYTAAFIGFDLSPVLYGVLVGSTLQEVAQVLAAGYTSSAEAGDLAVLVKLSRVALLAPALVALSFLARRGDAPIDGASPARRTPILPNFLVGFLVVGGLVSLGLIPDPIAEGMELGSLLLTAAAMAGLGLGVDLAVFRRVGGKALLLGTAGFAALVALMVPFSIALLP